MSRSVSPRSQLFILLGAIALWSCVDEPTAPTPPSLMRPGTNLPGLQRGVGTIPIVTAGGLVPAFPGEWQSGVLAANGRPTLAKTPRTGASQTTVTAGGHTRHILLENSATGDRMLWVLSGGAVTGSVSIGNVPASWRIVGSGDFNADGFDDVIWENTGTGGDGTRAVWFMDGNGRPTASLSLGVLATEWRIVGGGDYDDDGRDDILLENTNDGSRAIWLMNNGRVTNAVLIGTLSTNWHMIAASDLNSDSRADILLEDATTGNKVLWAMNKAVVQSAVLLGTMPLEWKISAATDIDGDSRNDILFENTSTGARAAWLEDGFGRVTSAPLIKTLDPVWHIGAVLVPTRGGFPSGFTLRVSPFITSGLTAPVFLTAPLNDGRIFVVEQGGKIRVIRDGALQTIPFLDISSKLSCCGERGLLSVAFHPQYATNRFFYVYFTGLSGEIRINRYTATSNPEVADPLSEKLIFTTPHSSADNHNGGLVSFGPDGMLYAALGDGGGGGDPLGNGQNYNAYLGGMIRIDVDHGDPYAIPADNPFVGQTGKRPELWAKGLRNPWRYAFDPPTGLLIIADVGQGLHEEVNAVAARQGGLNYGWNVMEGFSCYNATTCNQAGLQLPILDFGHTNGACSITGGYVYRGRAIPAMRGHYFYSDFCAGFLRSLRYQNGAAADQRDWGIPALSSVKSFGQDAAGELYIISGNTIQKVVQGS